MEDFERVESVQAQDVVEDEMRQLMTDDMPMDIEDEPDERTQEIDQRLATDQAADERSGKGKGMHSTARNRATVGPSGPKAVLADKHAHDLDEDIRRRRGRAALAHSITSAAYGTSVEATPSVSWAATGRAAAVYMLAAADEPAPLHSAGAAGSEAEAEADLESDSELLELRRRRLLQMRQAAAVPAGRVLSFADRADMGEALSSDRDELATGRAARWRVVHLREDWHAGCRAVDVALRGVAGLCERAGASGEMAAPVSVCAIRSDEAIRGYEPDALPTLAVYRGGTNAAQLVAVLGGEAAATRATVESVAALLRDAGVPVPASGAESSALPSREAAAAAASSALPSALGRRGGKGSRVRSIRHTMAGDSDGDDDDL